MFVYGVIIMKDIAGLPPNVQSNRNNLFLLQHIFIRAMIL